MASIHIKSIGPLTDTGVLELRAINVFIGKQSTGKSTILKILSYCRWIEKLLCIGKPKNGRGVRYAYTHNYRFIQELIKFYRFDQDFFKPDSEIIYLGDKWLRKIIGNPLLAKLATFCEYSIIYNDIMPSRESNFYKSAFSGEH